MRTFVWAIEDVVAAYPELEHAVAMAVALMRRTDPLCQFAVHVDGLAIDEIEGETQFVLGELPGTGRLRCRRNA